MRPLASTLFTASIGLFLALSIWTGCSGMDGEPWGWVDGSTGASGSIVESGPQQSNDALTIDSASATIDARLVETTTSSGGSGGSFDPQTPPEGYTLCHNGHCHSESGELVPYEDVRRELSSAGGTSTTTVARLEGVGELTDGSRVELGRQSVGSESQVDALEVELALELRGTYESDGETTDVAILTGRFDMSTALAVQFGPDAPAERTLELDFDWTGSTPLDGIDFDSLQRQNDTIRITQILNSDARDSIVAALQEGTLQVRSTE